MVETGKRSHQRDRDTEGKNQKRRPSNKDNSGEGELVVYRILCPGGIIGSIIGKGGKVINSLRQETRAKIKVVDPFPGAEKRIITIYCHVKDKDSVDVDEDDSEPLCTAQDALLKVHQTIVNALANNGDEDSDSKRKEEAEILVPASQASNIIGKAGAIIKRLRAKTRANIRVSPKDPSNVTHSLAMSFDNFVQITGDTEAVKRALFAVSAIMYKISPKEEISLDVTIPELPPSIIIPSDVPMYPANSFYPSADALISSHSSVAPVIGATTQSPVFHGYTDTSSAWPVYPSALPVVSGYGASSRSGELIVRVVCPRETIGRVIGKGGSSIKSVRQASGARVDVDDTKGEAKVCVITVTSTESTDDTKSAAVEAILLLQEKINDEDDETVDIRLLVPSKVIGCLIGKNGSIVNDMRKRTKADIRISKGEKPECAASSDELVEVKGESGNVRDALVQITLRLREDILRDRDGSKSDNAHHTEPIYSSSLSMPPVLHSMPPATQFGYDQRVETGNGLGMLSGSSLYGYGSLQARDDDYGSLSSYSTKAYGGLPSFTEFAIPAHALSKVMGKGGANLANIRKISGADVEVVDSKTSRFERVAQISGTPDQKRAAENLIQAFIMST
ncbi:KH domain-containing protein-like [Iris pallida]|uniref:KH domain-containing protein-like n=1 Tax=Iris pallida TaxID=29817 RepID=A0AAX6F8V3_IRIPA|nr:KH domain-containing protein-like [Iris pallida]KAJ6812431.1 KH domain-containing protein-like [Iris pallida]